MKKIVCIGNPTEDTARCAANIATQYQLPCVGLATDSTQDLGVCYTDLGSISQEDFLLLGEQADIVVILDQPIDSYDSTDTYAHTHGCGHWLKSFTRVVFENQAPDVYITTGYVPPNRFNIELHQVINNAQIIEKLKTININGRRVFVEFGTVNNINEFDNQLADVLEYTTMADFVIFRASPHEVAELHRSVTIKLFNTREFVMMSPQVFNCRFAENVQTLLENHWQWLYGPRRSKYYHTAYTQL